MLPGPTKRHALPVLLIVAAVYYVTSPALGSQLAPLDDSLIPLYLGPDRHITWGETLGRIRREAATWGGRFIPLQMTLQMLEMKWRGFDARGWHADRTALALLSTLALYATLVTFLHPAGAAALAVCFLAGGHSEIWVNLGFTETYGVTLTLLGAACVAVLLRRGRSRPLALLPGFALMLLAALVKETFFPVLPAAAIFVYALLPRLPDAPPVVSPRRWRRGDVVAIALLLVGMGIVIAGNVIVLRTYGHFYKGGLSIGTFRGTTAFMLGAFARNWPWALPVSAAIVALVLRRDGAKPDARAMLFVVLAVTVMVLLPQLLVYGSAPSLYERYLVPAVLAPLAAGAAGFWVVRRRVSGPAGIITIVALASVMVAGSVPALRDARRNAAGFAESSRLFQASIAEVIALKQRMPDAPIVFHAGFVWEWETILAVSRYLSVGPVGDQPRYLVVPHYVFDPGDQMAIDLAARLERLSAEGGQGFRPLSELAFTDGHCIGVIFSGVKRPVCRHIVLIRGDRY